MATSIIGERTWSMTRDKDGKREYTLRTLVKGTSKNDGPATALLTPGLPLPGAPWIIGNDFDPWVQCQLDANVTPLVVDEPNKHWLVEQKFSSRTNWKCNDQQWDDPLLTPHRISGTFATFQEEAVRDRFGNRITNSAWEQITGPQNEWDRSKPTVKIEMNVPALNLGRLALMNDTVNAFPLWGLPPRFVKLHIPSWEEKWYGQCYKYYTVVLEFEINYDGWDRVVMDEGTKALNGRWDTTTGAWVLIDIAGAPPNPRNPAHFRRVVDRQNNPMRVVLNGAGLPADVLIGQPTFSLKGAALGNADATNYGTGYQVGDIIVFDGGTYTEAASVRVTAIEGSNDQIKSVAVQSAGTYTVVPPNPMQGTVDGGSGTGAVFNCTWNQTKPVGTGRPGAVFIQKYGESDFSILGLPTLIG